MEKEWIQVVLRQYFSDPKGNWRISNYNKSSVRAEFIVQSGASVVDCQIPTSITKDIVRGAALARRLRPIIEKSWEDYYKKLVGD